MRELLKFVHHSPAALMQLLVAAARKPTFKRIVGCPTYPAPVQTGDLAGAVDLLNATLKLSDQYVAIVLAKLFTEACPLRNRKGAGQFFTPSQVAEWGISQIPINRGESVVDAGSGTAVFAEAFVRRQLEVSSYIGVENDPVLALCAAHVLEAIDAAPTFKIWYTNFLSLSRRRFLKQGIPPPTVIVSNPPFVRFHNLRGRGKILAGLGASLGIKLSPLSGAGNYFLCKAAELLEDAESRDPRSRERGRILFYLPGEAAGSAHSRKLREDLRQRHGWQWTERPIPGELAKTPGLHSSALALLFLFERHAAQVVESPRQVRKGNVLGDVLDVRRGISTGCNRFFVLTEGEATKRQIPERYLRGVLPTRVPPRRSHFTADDWNMLRRAGHPCWLLTLPNVPLEGFEPAVQSYLREGIREGLHETPTARRLRTWYSLPLPKEPPDVFISYLFRGAPRFVVNDAGVLHLTNILGGRVRIPSVADQIDNLVGLLNSLALTWIEDGGAVREYRDGLRKIEPGDLKQLPITEAITDLFQVGRDYVVFPRTLALFE